MLRHLVFLLVFAIVAAGFEIGYARVSMKSDSVFQAALASAETTPAHCRAQHNVGAFNCTVSNYGRFGSMTVFGGYDCIPGLEWSLVGGYPLGNHNGYRIGGALWIGAVVARDTVVSTARDDASYSGGFEFHPDEAPFGYMKYRSIIDPSAPEYEGARSEQDFIAVYTDTFGTGAFGVDLDPVDNRPHRPLPVQVTQNSYAWSYSYAEDFVLMDLSLENIGEERLWDVYIGLYVDGDVSQWWDENEHHYGGDIDDDICGFLPEHATSYGGCNWTDTVNLAWFADNDGDFLIANDLIEPLPHVAGVRLLRTPGDALRMSFNWWATNYEDSSYTVNLDWGPQSQRWARTNQTGKLGMPDGDRHKYHFMRNGEFDYDQVYTKSISPADPVWLYPDQAIAGDVSDGMDARFLLSFGPFSIEPGQSLPVSFAMVMGKDLHSDPYNLEDNITTVYRPNRFYENLDFSDIVTNAMWASWVYDNPGVDTDGNGYAGEYRLCCEDSSIASIDSTVRPYDTVWTVGECEEVWYCGDGVPDLRGASPPPAPIFWLEPEVGRIRIRWNGSLSETTKDIFTHRIDFEGYRVYYSLDSRSDSYALLASYDRANYDKYVWVDSRHQWEVQDIPMALSDLRCLYGDSCNDLAFDPQEFSRQRPYVLAGYSDSIFYFTPHEYNCSDFGLTTPICKVYPDEPPPHTLMLDSADASELTEEGYFRYFEYEFTIENLLSSIPYYINVTAFDFGSPKSGLSALETSKTLNPQVTYSQPTARDVAAQNLKVYVYPNPYRTDGGYYDMGFEGRDARWYIPDRMHRIHFANLPNRCTIGIYSLDGDLIREWEHVYPPDDPLASHDTWDLITRNTQLVVSGLYYWVVEDERGNTQIGKLVIIK